MQPKSTISEKLRDLVVRFQRLAQKIDDAHYAHESARVHTDIAKLKQALEKE